ERVQGMKIEQVAIETIELRDGCQCRAELNQAVVDEYAEAYAAGTKLPPVSAMRVDGALILTDGFHRFAAATKASVGFLLAEVSEGESIHAAVWAALAMNKAHGLRRTNADKRRATEMALLHPDSRELSDREIARHLGVSQDLVSRTRRTFDTH